MAVRKSQGVFADSDKIISEFLGLEARRSIRHKKVAQCLVDPPSGFVSFSPLIFDLYVHICSKRTDRPPSRENWRTERQTRISPRNKSPEVLLERAIARLGSLGVLEEWYNQVPVASGLVNARDDKRAAVDLVRYSTDHVTLLELKWESDNPLFAAFEVLRYGIAFLYAWVHQDDLGYTAKRLMGVRRASLGVLAPHGFYEGFELGWVGTGVNHAIGEVAREKTSGALEMDFSFNSLPVGFRLPFASGADVLEIGRGNLDRYETISTALCGMVPVWES